jgi:hypothetical protein
MSASCYPPGTLGGSCLETLQRTAGFMGPALGNVLVKVRRITGLLMSAPSVFGGGAGSGRYAFAPIFRAVCVRSLTAILGCVYSMSTTDHEDAALACRNTCVCMSAIPLPNLPLRQQACTGVEHSLAYYRLLGAHGSRPDTPPCNPCSSGPAFSGFAGGDGVLVPLAFTTPFLLGPRPGGVTLPLWHKTTCAKSFLHEALALVTAPAVAGPGPSAPAALEAPLVALRGHLASPRPLSPLSGYRLLADVVADLGGPSPRAVVQVGSVRRVRCVRCAARAVRVLRCTSCAALYVVCCVLYAVCFLFCFSRSALCAACCLEFTCACRQS